MRAEHRLDLTFGDIVHDRDGDAWVFVGWRTNTAGRFPVFVKEQKGAMAIGAWDLTVYHYYASSAATLINKFPDLVRKIKGEANDPSH